jgi:sodium-coupled neutral amino acid transporter 11
VSYCFPLTGIPYALHQAGFAIGLLLLILVALATDYSLVLLIRSGHLSGAFSYQGLMEAAFGKPGFILLSLLQFIYPFIGNYKSCKSLNCVVASFT